MAEPKQVLSPTAYKNYRNVRAVAILYVFVFSLAVLGAIALAFGGKSGSGDEIPPAVSIGVALVSLAGAIGGIAVLRGNKRWAPLVYGVAVLQLVNFPLGTIFAYVMLTGLSRYLRSVEELHHVALGAALPTPHP
jgi:hypothetical protein